jgi:hypothetical protein
MEVENLIVQIYVKNVQETILTSQLKLSAKMYNLYFNVHNMIYRMVRLFVPDAKTFSFW